MTTAQILRAAAARVRQGWCQGSMVDGFGNVCAVGAIDIVTPNTLADACVRFDVLTQLQLVIGYSGCAAVAEWNDEPGRTAEEVALAMEQAADVADGVTA